MMTRNKQRQLTVLILSLCCTSCITKNVFVVNNYGAEDKDDLVSVVVLFRHGDRSPITSYPNDPYYDISYWPEGYGQLLSKGKERQYELGLWFRKRYAMFLPEEYTPNDIRVISTDVDRTLTSAASNLAGLYPPPVSQIWNKELLWEPIPIHTISFSDDEILAMAKDCPKYNKLFDDVISSDYFKNVSLENKDFFDYVSYHTGWNNTTISNIGNLHDVFYAYRQHNASYIPSWANDLDEQKFSYLSGLNFAKETFTDELKRLKVGPFFNYLITYFDSIVKDVTATPKFLMLSGHDSTITAVLNSMGAYDNWPPEYASTVFWELRRNNSGTYYINLLYKRNSTDILEILKVGKCKTNCLYDDFKNNLQTITINPTTWEDECKNDSTQITSYWYFLFLTTMLLLITI